MNGKLLIITVSVIATAILATTFTVSLFFTNQHLYEAISSYERIHDTDNSAILDEMRQISEVDEFLAKHINTNRIIAVEIDPIFTTLHASGGYTGEYLQIYYLFDEPQHITYGCWTDNAKAPDLLFTSNIIHHIKHDSCLDHFLGKNLEL